MLSPPRVLLAAALLGLVLVGHLAIVANPGYFNHDELQRMDLVEAQGFASYARQYGAIHSGPSFGVPVRPVGFLQQGASALLMRDAPLLVHLIDVVQHAANVLLLWLLLLQAGLATRRATLTAAIFALSPLATLSTAWVGASFDRWYVGFALLCGIGGLRVLRRGADPAAVALVLVGASGAILSKESALMLPAALAIAALALRACGQPLPLRRVVAVLALSAIPILAFLVVRAPALLASATGTAVDPYAPSMAQIPTGVLIYFAQPFLPGAVELNSAFLLPRWQWAMGLMLHAGLLAALAWRGGTRIALLYLAGYFVFLLPVLPSKILGAHYLYGSGIAFALMLAALLPTTMPTTRPARWGTSALLLLALLLVARSQFIQAEFYRQGLCGSRLMASLDAQLPAQFAAGAARVRIVARPGATEHVAHKILFARPAYLRDGHPTVVVGHDAAAGEGDARFDMTPACLLERA